MIKDNLAAVRCNIAVTAVKSGRKPEDITLVCVTKQADMAQIKEAVSCGVTDIGENRVQDAAEKYKLLAGSWELGAGSEKLQTPNSKLQTIKWHLIGHLQTNKVKKAVEIFDLI